MNECTFVLSAILSINVHGSVALPTNFGVKSHCWSLMQTVQ